MIHDPTDNQHEMSMLNTITNRQCKTSNRIGFIVRFCFIFLSESISGSVISFVTGYGVIFSSGCKCYFAQSNELRIPFQRFYSSFDTGAVNRKRATLLHALYVFNVLEISRHDA